jgi:predicted AAA+ superfamily ATPase
LSYKEILFNNHIKTPLELYNHKIKALKLIENMLHYGSFPEIFHISDVKLKREVLLNYYETIVLQDCIFNHNVRETKTLEKLALYMLTNCATSYSYNSLAKGINSNDNTIKEFIHILENGFLIDEIKHFSYSLKTQAKNKKKSYCVDNGLLQAIALRFTEDKGKLFENLVFTELKKSDHYQIYFFNDEKECDFIIKKDKKLIALQIAFEITTLNRDREINGLSKAMQKFKINQGYIVTFNQKEPIDHQKEIVSFWEFFFTESCYANCPD